MMELRPIRVSFPEWDEIEKKIKALYRKEIYLPLLKELGVKQKLQNSKEDLVEAIRSGKLTYSRGKFSGLLNASLSKELRALGATWDRKQKCYALPLKELPEELQLFIRASASLFEQKIERLDRKLASVVPEELASRLKISKLFDRTLWKTNRAFEESVRKISLAPKLSEEERKRLADEWQNNMKLWIKNFTEEEVKRLRVQMKKSVESGNRYGSAVQAIQDSYGVTANKAKFLASQETKLMMTKFKEVRYASVGLHEYKWQCVKGSAMHPVRPRHKELNDMSEKGQLFRFDDPPIVSEPGQPVRRANAGADWNCRCISRVVLRFKEKGKQI